MPIGENWLKNCGICLTTIVPGSVMVASQRVPVAYSVRKELRKLWQLVNWNSL